jgi:hypothetical protein
MSSCLKYVAKVLAIFVISVTLVACSKISQKNFDKIQPNMSMSDVIAILGNPSSSDSMMISGISGTSAVWKDENAEINIQFLNNKMVVKSFSKEKGDNGR